MKIFFGGSFDPIHNGHTALANAIAGLFNTEVSLLPISGVPNYKLPPKATVKQRVEMLQIICANLPNINIDYTEINLHEYSPTIYTLERLRKLYGDTEEFYFIIGSDSLLNLEIWDEWTRLFDYTNFIVAMRPDYNIQKISPSLHQVIHHRITHDINQRAKYGKIIFVPFTPTDISSTQIRELIKKGSDISDLVDPQIHQYIIKNNLYKG